ncbi:MAG: disulfide bond formation protein B [Deltaproteobacteria bacterium]|nr:disulfide bond formation protein B [Deltaproteobacteria bacterium]
MAGRMRQLWELAAKWGLFEPGKRQVWFVLGGLALGLELFSYVYFQAYLKLRPCELCVYIRFSMTVVFLGAMLVALNPRQAVLQLAGGLIILWALLQGLVWDLKLKEIYYQAAAPDYYALCSPSAVRFPFGLPLERWLPTHFAPTAPCGVDGWRFLGLNMAELLLPVYAFFLAAFFGLWWKGLHSRLRPSNNLRR